MPSSHSVEPSRRGMSRHEWGWLASQRYGFGPGALPGGGQMPLHGLHEQVNGE